jgi:hypothetical protein
VSDSDVSPKTEVARSHNSIALQQPYRLTMIGGESSTSLQPEDNIEISVMLHASQIGERELSLLFVYREVDVLVFYHPDTEIYLSISRATPIRFIPRESRDTTMSSLFWTLQPALHLVMPRITFSC